MSTDVERIKRESRLLRGSIAESLADPLTGALRDDDTQLTKYHGIYQQDDRDLRIERQRQRLEPAYQFMIRARVPAGICSADQWRAMTRISREFADGTLRLTTRQAFQWHGVLKGGLKPSIQAIDGVLMDTLAACGDVNRNVMATPNPHRSALHARTHEIAASLSAHLTPRTRAWHEIWLDGEKLEREEEEPIYGATYLPRKFKISFAVPPDNDTDVFAQDLSFIAILEDGALAGFNVAVGGGMGATHGDPSTYPRLADVIGFCAPEAVNAVAEEVVKLQRDHGNRENRRRARLKYTIDDRGLDWFTAALDERLRKSVGPLAPARAFRFERHTDRYGWVEGDGGLWHRTVFVESGRLQPPALDAIDALLEVFEPTLILTPNQNLIIAGVPDEHRETVDRMLVEGGFEAGVSPLRAASIACVGLPTCSLSMAESERYLPTFVTRLENLFREAGVDGAGTVVRMTGCPNGCARPYLAEIGLVGKAPGRYNVHLGGDGIGTTLNRLWLENETEPVILERLAPLLGRWVTERRVGEGFGAFVNRERLLEDAA